MTSSPADYAQQLSGYLHAWRQYLEQTAGVTAPSQAPPWGAPPMPPAGPYGPPSVPTAAPSPAAGPPMDYTQQLLVYLQAWRQYLAHAMSVAAPGQCRAAHGVAGDDDPAARRGHAVTALSTTDAARSTVTAKSARIPGRIAQPNNRGSRAAAL